MNDFEPKHLLPDFNNNRQSLPNATAVLVLGILSIVFCFAYGIIGLILSIIALVLAARDKRLYLGSPELYSADSYRNMNAGRVCAIIGLILSAMVILLAIIGLIVALSLGQNGFYKFN